jgi:hypothetical protein
MTKKLITYIFHTIDKELHFRCAFLLQSDIQSGVRITITFAEMKCRVYMMGVIDQCPALSKKKKLFA